MAAFKAHDSVLSKWWLKHPARGRSCVLGLGRSVIPYGFQGYKELHSGHYNVPVWYQRGFPPVFSSATSGFMILTYFVTFYLLFIFRRVPVLKGNSLSVLVSVREAKGWQPGPLAKESRTPTPMGWRVKAVLDNCCTIPSPGCCKHQGFLQNLHSPEALCALLMTALLNMSEIHVVWLCGPPPPLGAYLMPGVAGDF